jgi:hypothetical protein
MNFLMAAFAFAVFAIFVGILIVAVPSPDLIAVALITVGFVAWDFITSIKNKTY